jgi:hypothetical protein
MHVHDRQLTFLENNIRFVFVSILQADYWTSCNCYSLHLLLRHCPLFFSVAVSFSEYILAPDSRIVFPALVHQVNDSVTNAESLTGNGNGSSVFNGVSAAAYDCSNNIAGVISVSVDLSSSSDVFIGLKCTEFSLVCIFSTLRLHFRLLVITVAH